MKKLIAAIVHWLKWIFGRRPAVPNPVLPAPVIHTDVPVPADKPHERVRNHNTKGAFGGRRSTAHRVAYDW